MSFWHRSQFFNWVFTDQDGSYLNLGTRVDHYADIRFVAATNTVLKKRMRHGHFRKDLFYRIRGGWLYLPPLYEHKAEGELFTKP